MNKYGRFVLLFSMKQKQFTVSRQANYYTLGEPSADEWWILFHGYAQRADEILRDCSTLQNENRFLLAPEGLSRFYREGFSGEIGASWMTAYGREAEIQDYIGYLNEWWKSISAEGQPKTVNVLGFSQGVATSTRWIHAGELKPDKLILFAGSPGHEINPTEMIGKAGEFYFVFGNRDPFFSEEEARKKLKKWQDAGVEIDIHMFDGKHRIIPDSVKLIEEKIA